MIISVTSTSSDVKNNSVMDTAQCVAAGSDAGHAGRPN